MNDAEQDDDTVVSHRRDAARADDTLVSSRRSAPHVDGTAAETAPASGEDLTTDTTAIGSRRRTGADTGDTAQQRREIGHRDAYAPDAASLRGPAPVRAAQPVIVSRRPRPADSDPARVRDSVDRESVDRATRARARRRAIWLFAACVAAAAAAATALILLSL